MKHTLISFMVLALTFNAFASTEIDRAQFQMQLQNQLQSLSTEDVGRMQNEHAGKCLGKRTGSFFAKVVSLLPLGKFIVDQTSQQLVLKENNTANSKHKTMQFVTGLIGGLATLIIIDGVLAVGGTVQHAVAVAENVASPYSSAGTYDHVEANRAYSEMIDGGPKMAFDGAIAIDRANESSEDCVILKATQIEIGRRYNVENNLKAPSALGIELN